jgi:hypothetical protein
MPRCLPSLFLAVALAAVLAAPLAGQAQVTGVRDLNFGVVIRGMQNVVAPSDPVRSGQYYVRYVTGGRVHIRFTLPSQLARVGGGATMPITFRNSDAIAQGTAAGSAPVTFNPNGNHNFNLQTSPDFNVWLGGRVTPAAAQQTGIYRATVIMTVIVF